MKVAPLIAAALLLGLSAAWAQQEPFEIKGKIGSLNSPARIYFSYEDGDQTVQDSVELKNGKFAFRGDAQQATAGMLILSHDGNGLRSANDYRAIYLHKGTIKLNATDSLINASFKGSRPNMDYQRLQESLKPIDAKAKSLYARYQAASQEERISEAFLSEYEAERSGIRDEQRAVFLDFINKNPRSPVSLIALERYGDAIPDVAEVEPLFSGLSKQVKNSTLGKAYAQRIENIKRTEIGQSAPQFTQNDPDGNPVSLNSFKGKYVLIDFWASWCGPCRVENPNVVKTYEAYKGKNFTILGVSLDNERGREAWLKAIQDDKLNWTHVSDLKGWKNEVATLYAIRAIPQNFLIDPNGMIIARDLRGEELTKKIGELLD